MAASGAGKPVVADARTINRKIQGKSKTQPQPTPPANGTPAPTPTEKSISNSQQSYDSLIDHFTKLVQSVTQQPSYAPNETDLTVASLNTQLNSLITANTAVVNAYTAWSNARIDRNNALYNTLTGLVPTALDVKQYIKSIFNASSPTI